MGIPKAGMILHLALAAAAIWPCLSPGQGTAQAGAGVQAANTAALRVRQEELLALTNQARAEAGRRPVRWDPALAAAALKHCMRMAAEGPIAHRYGGEPDVSERAAQAGAHFSLIAENVALGSRTTLIQQGWLESPGHRANMLNADVDSVGIAVVASGGVLYAVADFARTVQAFSPMQAESAVAVLLRARRLQVLNNANDARAACVRDHGLPSTLAGPEPHFVMRWQDSDLSHLPQGLLDKIASGDYQRASVGSCPAQSVDGAFTVYRMAVLLYRPPSTNELKSFY